MTLKLNSSVTTKHTVKKSICSSSKLIKRENTIDAEVVGKLAELDMVTMDLERANGRIIQLEKKVDDLKEENAKLQETRDDMEGYSHYSL